MKEGLMGACHALAGVARLVGIAAVTVALSSEAHAQVSAAAAGDEPVYERLGQAMAPSFARSSTATSAARCSRSTSPVRRWP